jgi:Domain of unknown function (DUF2437)
MKWCRFLVEQRISYGLIDDDRVIEVGGSPFAEHIGVLRNHVVAESCRSPRPTW